MPPQTRCMTPRIFAAVLRDATLELQAANRAVGFHGALRHSFHAASQRARHPSNVLSGQRMAQKSTTKCDMTLGIDRSPHFSSGRCCACCRCDLLTFSFVSCVSQMFVSQQRAVRLHTFTNDLLSVLLWLRRRVPRGHVVATAGSLLQDSSMDVREYACTCACAPFWRPQRLVCINYRCQVDVSVKKCALGRVYMSRLQSSTVPKRNLSVWKVVAVVPEIL